MIEAPPSAIALAIAVSCPKLLDLPMLTLAMQTGVCARIVLPVSNRCYESQWCR